MRQLCPGEIVLADTSARLRADHPVVRESWAHALAAGRIVSCVAVAIELITTARNAHDVAITEEAEATFRNVPVTVSVQRAAIGALRALARRGAGYHRVPLPDVLIAAAAQEAGAGVLHYDRHFDRLAEVLHFRSVWLAAPGTL
jgi:predicted nucleic acid-binding protein